MLEVSQSDRKKLSKQKICCIKCDLLLYNQQMGQNQGTAVNPLLQDWYQHAIQANVYINRSTGDVAEAHVVGLKKSQEPAIYKRMNQNHKYIASILYYEPVQKHKFTQQQQKYIIYTEKLYEVTPHNWSTVNSALSILKGFRRLSMSFGYMRVSPGMIKMNNKKEIRVWVNQQSAVKCQIMAKCEDQRSMVQDICCIIKQFDMKTGSLIEGSNTIHQAISAILHSMTDHVSSKPSFYTNSNSKNQKYDKNDKNEQKKSIINCSNGLASKNNFRSTKQTQDNQLKPIDQIQIRLAENNIIGCQTTNNKQPFVYHPKQLKMINDDFDSKSLHSSDPRKYQPAVAHSNINSQSSKQNHTLPIDQNNSSSTYNYNYKQHFQNPNLSQPEKLLLQSGRSFKPNYTSNYNHNNSDNNNKPKTPTGANNHGTGFSHGISQHLHHHNGHGLADFTGQNKNYQTLYSGQLTPTHYSKPYIHRQASKFKQMLHQQQDKSDKYIKSYDRVERADKSQLDDRSKYYKSRVNQFYQKSSQVDTSRDIKDINNQSKSFSLLTQNQQLNLTTNSTLPLTPTPVRTHKMSDPVRTNTSSHINTNPPNTITNSSLKTNTHMHTHTHTNSKAHQFYTMNTKQAPRFKTNHLPTTCTGPQYQTINLSQSTINLQKPKNYGYGYGAQQQAVGGAAGGHGQYMSKTPQKMNSNVEGRQGRQGRQRGNNNIGNVSNNSSHNNHNNHSSVTRIQQKNMQTSQIKTNQPQPLSYSQQMSQLLSQPQQAQPQAQPQSQPQVPSSNTNNTNINSNTNINKSGPQQDKNKITNKMKQIKQLRQQMNFLGIQTHTQPQTNTNTNNNNNNNNESGILQKDKSARDLLIKKKVQQKNRKHQDLKNAMSLLLKQS